MVLFLDILLSAIRIVQNILQVICPVTSEDTFLHLQNKLFTFWVLNHSKWLSKVPRILTLFI